jgi:hypothetical protein
VSLLVLRYSLLRLALFAVVLGALWVVGARGILLVALTVVVSLALSYLLLRRQRDALAAAIAARVETRPEHRGGVDEAAEDGAGLPPTDPHIAADEAQRARSPGRDHDEASASPRPSKRP